MKNASTTSITPHHVTLARVILWAFLVANNAAAEVYKCPDPGGKHKFQDTPCTGGARQNVKPVTINSTPGYKNRSDTYPRTSSSDPMVGMGKLSLIQALGPPSRTNTTTNGAGEQIESLMFTQHDKTIMAYLKNGFVFSTTSVEHDRIGQSSSSRRKCPSATDIQNAETSASSITLTESERWEKRYEVARMKACLP